MSHTFSETLKVLSDLENGLRCNICSRIAESPCTLGGCEHIYCSTCCEELLGQSCPVCHIPVHVRDAQVNRQLFNLVRLCHRLKGLLTEPGNADNYEDRECNETTVRKPYLGDYGDPRLNTPVKLRNSKSKRDDAGKKKKGHNSVTKSTRNRNPRMHQESISCEPCQPSSIEHDDLMLSKDSKTNDPVQQTTMTQFFDYMETDEICNNDLLFSSLQKEIPRKRNVSQKWKTVSEGGEREDNETSACRLSDCIEITEKSFHKRSFSEDTGLVSVMEKESKNNMADRRRKRHSLEEVSVNVIHREGNSSSRPMTDTPLIRKTADKRGRRRSLPINQKQTKKVATTPSSSTSKPADTPSMVPLTQRLPKNLPNTPKSSRSKPVDSPSSKCGLNSPGAGALRLASPLIVDKKNAKGETPLQVACIKGNLQRVEDLLMSGANPNSRDNAGWTPLHEACHYGHVSIAKMLLENGALIDVPGTDNETPLHDAVRHLRIDCIKLLVQHGASISARNIKGITPLDMAGTDEIRSLLQTAPGKPEASIAPQVDVLSYQTPCFMSTGLTRDQKIVLQKCAAKLKAKVVEEYCPEVTHVISSCNKNGMCPRTLKYLQGVLAGRWIVSMEWVEMCLEYGTRVCEEAFEILGTSSDPESMAPQKGRINRQQQLPGLFDGCQFYFSGSFEYPTPDKEELSMLVKLGGGHIISREPKPGHILDTDLTTPYHASASQIACCIFIVYDNNTTFQPVSTPVMSSVPASWIMDCISQFKLLDPKGFVSQ